MLLSLCPLEVGTIGLLTHIRYFDTFTPHWTFHCFTISHVRERQTDVRRASSLNTPYPRGWGITVCTTRARSSRLLANTPKSAGDLKTADDVRIQTTYYGASSSSSSSLHKYYSGLDNVSALAYALCDRQRPRQTQSQAVADLGGPGRCRQLAGAQYADHLAMRLSTDVQLEANFRQFSDNESALKTRNTRSTYLATSACVKSSLINRKTIFSPQMLNYTALCPLAIIFVCCQK